MKVIDTESLIAFKNFFFPMCFFLLTQLVHLTYVQNNLNFILFFKVSIMPISLIKKKKG